ncbi:MAG: SsrA-binding protein SmpB [Bacteroidetes bacterium]|nr:SsrA-binding protein SmpB [Bacteroidota bacterium]
MDSSSVEIKNKRASFEYAFLEKFIAGMVLRGSEIKAIRQGKATITDGFCVFANGELIARNLQINEYEKASHFSHAPKSDRKLLLKKSELKKLEEKMKDKGLAIIPLKLFINEKGWAKLEIALAKGKKQFDKRADIKKKDLERETQRRFK